MATITKQGRRMTSQAASTKAAAQSGVRRTPAVNYKMGLLMWVACIQYFNLASVLWTLVVPEASRGIIGFIHRDFSISPVAIASLYLISIGVSWRGVKARYGLLFVLLGQLAMALISLIYTLNNTITLTQLAGHGGLFVLSALGIAAVTQYEAKAAPRYEIQKMLIPTIGVILALYGIGLGARADGGIAMFIKGQFGSIVYMALIVWFTLGGGYALPNHLSPWRLFVCVVPLFLYAYMAVSLLASDNSVSFTGIMVHLELAIMMGFIVMIQVREYARAMRDGA